MALDKTMDSKFDFPIFFYKIFPHYGTSSISPVIISELNKMYSGCRSGLLLHLCPSELNRIYLSNFS